MDKILALENDKIILAKLEIERRRRYYIKLEDLNRSN